MKFSKRVCFWIGIVMGFCALTTQGLSKDEAQTPALSSQEEEIVANLDFLENFDILQEDVMMLNQLEERKDYDDKIKDRKST